MKKRQPLIGLLIVTIIILLTLMAYSNIEDIKRGWHDGCNAAQKGK